MTRPSSRRSSRSARRCGRTRRRAPLVSRHCRPSDGPRVPNLRPVGIAGNGVGRREAGVRPPRDGSPRRGESQGELERLAEAERPMGYERVDLMVGHHHFVPQRIDQRDGDRGGERGDQADPPRREPWAEKGHRQNEPTGQSHDLGVGLHHLDVGEHVGTADPRARGRRSLDHRAPRRGSTGRRESANGADTAFVPTGV